MSALTLRPPDDDARVAIASDLGRTIFVEAGAGTGKTSQLVARIVNLVAVEGVDVGRIAAITFTEAAAAELRQRVRGRLAAAAGDPARSAAEQAACATALTQLDDATISTLHAFAQRLIMERPLEAGVPPALDLATDLEAARDFEERWQAFLERLLDRGDLEEALSAGITLGLTVDKLRDIAVRFHDEYDRLEGVTFTPRLLDALDPKPVVEPLEAVDDLLGACLDHGDQLLAHLLTTVLPLRTRIAAAGDDPVALLRALASIGRIDQSKGRAESWAEGAKARVVEVLREADEARRRILHECRAAVLSQLLPHLADFARAAADERRRCGRLVFHDLLVLARDLLRDHPRVRRELATRYQRVLIDEFQDTDPLQIEIGVLLAADPAADVAGRRWDEIDVEPGRLFVVGDPKQSIYRFRRADIDLYLRVRDRFGDGLELLQANFRSRPGVLRWVNEVLERMMTAAAEGTQAPYVTLEAGVPDDGRPCVHLLGGPVAARVGEIRRREARELTRLVASVRGRWAVRDDDERGGTRPARYDDVAILLPTRASLPHLERALDDAAIPYRIESRSLVFASAEVRDVVNVLRAADDPDDAIAVVAALRTPALAVSDRDLVAWRQAGGSWDHRHPVPEGVEADHPVAAGLRFLAALHDDRWWASVSDLVERIVRERRLLELALAHRRPRDHWRRVQFVVDQARAFTERGGRTVREFVAWADEQAAERARVDENVVPEADDDAVRILTMHGAKGLEFPVAVLAGLSAEPSTMPPRVVWPVAGGPPEVAVGPGGSRFATDRFEEAATREKEMERAEEVRLLYVAATRARDHLVVSLLRPEGRQRSLAARLAASLGEEEAGAVVVDEVPPGVPETVPLPLDRPAASTSAREEWAERRGELLDRYATAPVVAATRLAAEARGEPDEAEERPVWQRGRAGTSVGRAVHAVLQSVDLATGAGVAEVAAAQAAAEGVSDRVEQVERLARAALASGVVAEAVSGRYWRELFVAAPLGARTVEGFVDLLYETPGGELVVVDYKTDELGDDDAVDAAVARYRLQGAAYAAAVESVAGRPVDRCVFLFLRRGEARAREVPDLPGAVAEVRARLEGSPA